MENARFDLGSKETIHLFELLTLTPVFHNTNRDGVLRVNFWKLSRLKPTTHGRGLLVDQEGKIRTSESDSLRYRDFAPTLKHSYQMGTDRRLASRTYSPVQKWLSFPYFIV